MGTDGAIRAAFNTRKVAGMVHSPKVAGVVVVLGLAACSVVPKSPTDGLYGGELCVATGTSPAKCGAADVSLFSGRAKVRVSDFVYDLLLHRGELDLMLVHGTTLVDIFSAPYAWSGNFLFFADRERQVDYRVRFADAPASAAVLKESR